MSIYLARDTARRCSESYMQITKLENKIGIIKSWNTSIDNKVCLVIQEHKYSHKQKFHWMLVLVLKDVYAIPRNNIKIL